MASPAEQRPDGPDDVPPATFAVSDVRNLLDSGGLTPGFHQAEPAEASPPADPPVAGHRAPEPAPGAHAVPVWATPAPGPAAPSRLRPARILQFGIAAAILIAGSLLWTHNRASTEASQATPLTAGTATMRITEPVTGSPSANGGLGSGGSLTGSAGPTASEAPSSGSTSGPPARLPAAGKVNTSGKNLALNKPATASSVEGRQWAPANAVDSDSTSRWSSGFSDPQWIAVDLGAQWQLSEIRLSWENAHATAYRVEVSTDGKKWQKVYSTGSSIGGDVTIEVAKVAARKVRVYCTKRSNQYGYSIYGIDVR